MHTIFEAIAASPQQRLTEIPWLSEAERQQLLVEWNDTEKEYPSDKCIHQLFEEQVEKTPDAIALVFEEQQLSSHAKLITNSFPNPMSTFSGCVAKTKIDKQKVLV